MQYLECLLSKSLYWKLSRFQGGKRGEFWEDGDEAIRQGHVGLLKNKAMSISSQGIAQAAGSGLLSTLEWIYCSFDVEAGMSKELDAAVENGHMETIQYILQSSEKKLSISRKALNSCCSNRHLALMDWVYQNRLERCTSFSIDQCAMEGSLESLEWLQKRTDLTGSSDAWEAAARHGHLAVVEWLHRPGGNPTARALDL
ncbi:unnamed protein product [Heterosigma akashiwo]